MPVITGVVQAPLASEVQPTNAVVVNASVFDELSGIKRVTLEYTVTSTTRYLEMTNLEGNIWTGTIPAFPDGKEITYAIIAEDYGGNTITTQQMGQTYEYQVIPEFPSWAPLLILLFAVTAVAVIYRRSLHKHDRGRRNQ